MKVCLISAPTANEFDDRELAESEAVRAIAEHAPLGLLSLAGVLEAAGVEPAIVDLNRLYYDYLKSDEVRGGRGDFSVYAARHFEDLSFDFYGFSTICSSYPLTLRIAREVKRLHPDTPLALGGPQASVVDAPTLAAYSFVDYVVRGEAERTLPALLDALDTTGAVSLLPGLTFRRGMDVVRNGNAPVIEDLDTVPFPAFHLYPYTSACSYLPLELGRGCPFACTFCSTNDFFRRRFRLKTPARLVAEMKWARAAYGIDTFDLVHDMFTVDRKRVVAICQALLDCGETFYWGCSARTDCIDDELIDLMAAAGCRGIFFGIETGSNRLQKVIKKRLDLKEAADRIRHTDARGIKTAVSLITGFPEETMEDLRDTIHFFFDSLRYDYADPQLCLLAPLAETPIYTRHRDELVFDDVMSDMSFQGWRQDPLDQAMIAEHPEIFPNFYSVPTPHLDRHFLKELREFVLIGMSTFRWVLVALHQHSGNLVDAFVEWRAWRRERGGVLSGFETTVYYSSAAFHRDFLEFARARYLGRPGVPALALGALLDYEAAFAGSEGEGDSLPTDAPDGKDFGGLIGPDTIPRRRSGVRVTHLAANYKGIVDRLRRAQGLHRIRRHPVTLVTREVGGKAEILQLSALSSELLALCDGQRPVKAITEMFATTRPEIGGVPAAKGCIVGLELLRRQSLLVMTAPPPQLRPAEECTEAVAIAG